MNNLIKILGLVLMTGFLFTSCSQDDNIVVEEKEETLESSAEFIINGRSITTDAVAWYCNDNGKELLTVSNKTALLGLEINASEMVDGDYTFIMANDPSVGSYSIGGSFFPSSVTGSEFNSVIFDAAATIDVTSNSGTVVSGTMSGLFLTFDANGEVSGVAPYTVTFSADIIDSSTFCD